MPIKKTMKKKIFIPAIAIAVVMLSFGVYKVAAHHPIEAKGAEETATIERMDLDQSITMSGTVQSGSAYSVTSTITDTEIKSVNVKEGDRVTKGQIIAVLDDSQLQSSQRANNRTLSNTQKKNAQDISTAKRNLKNAKADKKTQVSRTKREYNEANRQYNNAVNERNEANAEYSVACNDHIVKQQEYDKAKADAAKAKKDIVLAEQELTAATEKADELKAKVNEIKEALKDTTLEPDAVAALNTSLLAAQKEYDNQKLVVTNKQGAYDLLKETIDKEAAAAEALNLAKDKEKEALEKAKTAREAVYAAKSVRDKASDDKKDARTTGTRNIQDQQDALNNARISADDNLIAPQQEAEKIRKDLDSCVVVAEADGIVTSVNVKPGDIYKGDTIAIIQDDNGFNITANVDQYDITSLADGQKAKITISAAEMEEAAGELTHVAKTPIVTTSEDGTVTTDSNYRVEARINNPSDKLRIGMTAKVVVSVWEKKNVLAVPDSCIQTDENGNKFVEVIKENGKHKKVKVKYGMKSDYYSEIIGDGIEEGMEVVMPALEETEESEE